MHSREAATLLPRLRCGRIKAGATASAAAPDHPSAIHVSVYSYQYLFPSDESFLICFICSLHAFLACASVVLELFACSRAMQSFIICLSCAPLLPAVASR